MYAAGLLPYLVAVYGDWVKKYFSPESVARSEDCTWDLEKNQLVTPMERHIMIIMDEDPHLHLGEVEVQIEIPPQQPNHATMAYGNSEDSIDTFQSKRMSRRSDPRPTSTKESAQSVSDTSNLSELTGTTSTQSDLQEMRQVMQEEMTRQLLEQLQAMMQHAVAEIQSNTQQAGNQSGGNVDQQVDEST